MAISKIIGSGLGTINSPVEFTSADNLNQLTLSSTDADAGEGPNLVFYRNSSSPADNDDLSTIDFIGRNDASQDVTYGQIKAVLLDASDGTEDARLEFYRMKGGTSSPDLQLNSEGVVINEGSGDVDFRVESNGNANMLFVDGGNNCVGIGTNTNHGGELNIVTAGQASNLVLVCTDTDTNEGPILDLRRDAGNVPSDNDAMGIINFQNDNTDLVMHTYASIASFVDDSSADTEDGVLRFNSIVDGTIRNRIDIIPSGIVFNEDSIDSDFRVESNNHDNIFFIDGGHDGIGIGNSTIIDWSTNYPGLQMGQAGALYGHKTSNQMSFAMNWGVTTGNVFIANGIASRMVMDTTKIAFDSSASGSAAGAITAIPLFNMTPTAGSVFNNDRGGVIDFRVASGANNHMFFIDSGADCVNIGHATNTVGASSGTLMVNFTGNSENGIKVRDTRGESGTNNMMVFIRGDAEAGSITTTTAPATQFTSVSDERLKENIADADDASSKIDAIKVRKFDWKSDGSHQDYGLIAQELQPIAPDAVAGDSDSEKMMSIDPAKLVPMMLKEIQSLRTRIAILEG